MNWDNARYFLAVARIGTLRGAAAALGVDQATVGRRLSAFEEELGTKLFIRTSQSYALTAEAERLLPDAEHMEEAADALARKSAASDSLTGMVRIATTDVLAELFLVRAVALLGKRHPQIDLTILTSPSVADLSRRAADVAVRTARPETGDFVIRRLTNLKMGLYASRAYIAARGSPIPGGGFANHELIMFPRDALPRRWQELCGEPLLNARVGLQVTSSLTMRSAALQDVGIAFLPTLLAERQPELVRILPDRQETVAVWLVVHSDLYQSERIRAVIQAIRSSFNSLPSETHRR
jgi:DNA-binding transcriptional LysR family regulator